MEGQERSNVKMNSKEHERSAIALANYYVEKSKDEGKNLDLLKLIKFIYFTWGWVWAYTKEELYNDRIEAWDFGPVIPSVYHAFKYQKPDITEKVVEARVDYNENLEHYTPVLDVSEKIRHVIDDVWNLYITYPSGQLIERTHADGPWRVVYRPGIRNIEIPKSLIQEFYERLVSSKS